MNTPPKKADRANLTPGDRVGAYIIEREIGHGGMADVYYGMHQTLERPAAIKVLRPNLATDEVHLQRFLQEAKAAAALVHPNIVQVYDVGQDGDLRYIAQEYIPGTNLRQYLSLPLQTPTKPMSADDMSPSHATQSGLDPKSYTIPEPQLSHAATTSNVAAGGEASGDSIASRSPVKLDRQLEIRETLSILLQILAALNKSASSQIVHRDIKPENIMLTQDGDVKVADFGLARLLLGDDPQLTRAGTTLGTPMYMSPEQIQEGVVDIRSDLYSLGVTLFHMLAGRPPFTGETPLALAMQHVQANAPDLQSLRPNLPACLYELVGRLLEKSPSDRFSAPGEVIQFLKERRSTDLLQHWPDETIPLPGAATASGSGPMLATLQLQAKLRKPRQSIHQFASRTFVAAILVGSFIVGAIATYSNPTAIFSSGSTQVPIERQANVQEQYRFALLDATNNRSAKWAAVEYYFPKEASSLNRLYAGLAGLQLSRNFREQGNVQRAQAKLMELVADAQMQEVIKALAYLQLAQIEFENRRESAMQIALSDAARIRMQLGMSDRNQIDAEVDRLPEALREAWDRIDL